MEIKEISPLQYKEYQISWVLDSSIYHVTSIRNLRETHTIPKSFNLETTQNIYIQIYYQNETKLSKYSDKINKDNLLYYLELSLGRWSGILSNSHHSTTETSPKEG